MDLAYPPDKRRRVIVNTDAKNEADDQFAIVHALLTPSFEIHGLIPAHYGTKKTDRSMLESRAEIDLILRLMGWTDRVEVANGAATALPDETTPVPSPGAELIIREALRDDPRRLFVLFFGPLTDMASALLTAPEIGERPVTVVWIGGGRWPEGGNEYNLSNDIASANVVMRSRVDVWMIPIPVFWTSAVSYAEMLERVYPHGPLGRYLVDQLVDWNARTSSDPYEYRILGDSPAVGLTIAPPSGMYFEAPAPEFAADMRYIHTGAHRPIRIYTSVDNRFLFEDFFIKLARFARGETAVPASMQRANTGGGIDLRAYGIEE